MRFDCKMAEIVPFHRFKTICTIVVVALLIPACGGGPAREDTVFTVRMVAARTIPGHWEVSAERGLDRISAELEADVARIQVDHPKNERGLLADMGRGGIDLVFCVGGFAEASVYSAAIEFPRTVYVVLPGRARADNVAGIEFVPEEAGYLAGAVAGALAADGPLGILHGSGRPWLEPLEEGYIAGFRSHRRKAKIVAGEGVDGAWQLAAAGALVSLYATDRPDPQVLAAVHDSGIRLVAADPELWRFETDTVVATVDLDVAESMVRVAREVRDGTFEGRVFSFDLGSGVLDVVLNPALAADELAVADEALGTARAEITAGLVEFDELGL
jgi:basic membrane protein A